MIRLLSDLDHEKLNSLYTYAYLLYVFVHPDIQVEPYLPLKRIHYELVLGLATGPLHLIFV